MKKISLMTAGRKICSMVEIKPNDVCALCWTTHFGIHKMQIKGLVLRTQDSCVVVPDITNVERLFMFSTLDLDIIVPELIHQGYTQNQVAGILHVSQGTISRHVKRGGRI